MDDVALRPIGKPGWLMPSIRASDLVRWAGSGLSVIAVLFVIAKFRDYSGDIDFSLISPLLYPLTALSLVYGAANLILAFSWREVLQHFGISVSRRWATRVFGMSQLAKYIPGNIFHFVSRQALGAQARLPAMPLAKSALWEIGILACAGSLAIPLVLPKLLNGQFAGVSLLLFALVAVSGVWICGRWLSRWIARALLWDVMFLTISGLVFVAVLALFTSVSGASIILIAGAYVLAWLAGLITPGAPAGVGIREFVLLALLQPFVIEADLLLAILAGRMTTIGGDFLFYLFAFTIKPPNQSAP